MDLTEEEIYEELINLAKDGEVIASCSFCEMILDESELEAQHCENCRTPLLTENITWMSTENLPEA